MPRMKQKTHPQQQQQQHEPQQRPAKWLRQQVPLSVHSISKSKNTDMRSPTSYPRLHKTNNIPLHPHEKESLNPDADTNLEVIHTPFDAPKHNLHPRKGNFSPRHRPRKTRRAHRSTRRTLHFSHNAPDRMSTRRIHVHLRSPGNRQNSPYD